MLIDMTESIGARLRLLRGSMTQPEFAKIAGTSKQHVSRIEGGLIREPSPALLERWARHFGVRVEWLITGQGPREAPAQAVSQPMGLDLDILGIALTSMDQVIRRRGLRMERHLGKFAPVLAFAYELAREAFPAGVPDPEKAEGKKALQAFDKQLDEFLGGGIADGSLGPFEADAGAGSGSTGTRTAQRKKAGSGRG